LTFGLDVGPLLQQMLNGCGVIAPGSLKQLLV